MVKKFLLVVIILGLIIILSHNSFSQQNLTKQKIGQVITLEWDASQDERVGGYYVYRSETPGGPYIKLTPQFITSLIYEDKIPLFVRTKYCYVVTACDKNGEEESAFSNEVCADVNTTAIIHGVENLRLDFGNN